ncbi:hypothetical protein M426DRAFT_105439 [Hypoxylon sp. CI-4A]|nr:hypothetical protein M426DRAFT_105439 [Hypoxylon sp. CI-4A]
MVICHLLILHPITYFIALIFVDSSCGTFSTERASPIDATRFTHTQLSVGRKVGENFLSSGVKLIISRSLQSFPTYNPPIRSPQMSDLQRNGRMSRIYTPFGSPSPCARRRKLVQYTPIEERPCRSSPSLCSSSSRDHEQVSAGIICCSSRIGDIKLDRSAT